MPRKTIIAIGASIALAAIIVACARKTNGEQPVTGINEGTTVPGALHGTVRTTDGNPVPNVMVNATSTDTPPAAIPELAILTDSEGNYEWPLPAGHYQLTVDTPDGTATGETAIEAGTKPVLDLTVTP